jgi:hypothetical protein
LGPVFMFCAPGLVFGGTEGVGSRINALRSRTRFRRCRGRRVPFSCFALPDSFSAVRERWILFSCFARPESFSAILGTLCPVFTFCALGLFFGGTEGVGSRFHVLRSQTRFRRYQGRRVPFSCFACPDSFSAVRRASCPVFMFCASGLIFGSTDHVGSHFHVLRTPTLFRRYLGRRVPFLCFALPDSFSAVPRASGPVFMFCVPGLVFGDTGGAILFSCFARPYSFSTVSGASGAVFMFCAPGLIFGGSEGVGSRFHVLHARTRFLSGSECVKSRFLILQS